MPNYAIKTASQSEVQTIIDFAAAEGWNPGLHDAATFYAADPGGFLIGMLDGEPVASISAVRYGASFGFIGLYIVKPEQRGKGYGKRIWDAGLRHLQGRNIGLDGVIEQQGNYQKAGLSLAWRNVRYQGNGGEPAQHDADIVALSAVPIAEVLEYDQAFFPDDRARFLQAWLSQPEGRAAGILVHGRLAGYGVMRRCRTGYKVGPLFADSAALADRLFSWLSAQIPAGTPVFLDLPEPNHDAVALALRHQLHPVFETARMYSAAAPDLQVSRTYGITSFELG